MNERSIFLAALEKTDPDQRRQYLGEACGNDEALREQVEQLLTAHQDADGFLEKPPAEFIPSITTNPLETIEDGGGEILLHFLHASDKPGCLGTLGPYEVIEVVGRGGMGIVLKGHDPKLNRVVAIKVLAPELASNAGARKRFRREGQAAAAISHDHVVTIHAVDEAGGLPHLVMEYISGCSLEDRIKREGPLELREVLRIGMQIASGLAAAHAQGLVHRDIKPANILLENGVERVKITDFGLARAVDDVRITRPGMVTGTPEYMSPEQARGESVDHRTDLFSLGSVLYAMCAGRSPFRAENTVAMIRRVCEDTPRPLQDINPDIPGWLVQIIGELLVKSAADRFQSAAELAELLGQCLAHLQEPSINPLPDGLKGHKSARAARRQATTRRRGWLAAAAVLLLGLGGLSVTEATGVTNVAGTVIRIVRGDGTLVIHVDDPEVSVSIDGEELVISGAGPKQIRLAVGQHELKAVKDGEPILTESVTIARDGKQLVKVDAEPLPPAEVAGAPDTEAAAGIELEEVWSFPGLDDLDVLTISRDGRYCVLADPESGGLMVRDLGTGEDQPLNARDSFRRQALISPDNKWVAYTEWISRNRGCRLRIAGIDGSQDRILYPNEERNAIGGLGWSPDSQHVLAAFYDTGGERIAQTSVPVRIAMVSVADGSLSVLKTLTPEEHAQAKPRFSPDGRYVAYGRVMDTASKQEDIFLIPLGGGPEIHLVESPADDDVLGWLPNGEHLLFGSYRPGEGYDIWMTKVVDAKPQGVPRLVRKGLPPGFSSESSFLGGPVRTPTGGWAFYYREPGEPEIITAVYIATLDPDTGKLLTAPKSVSPPTPGRERVLSPDFSRDGKYLAYYVAPAPTPSPKGPLYGPGKIVIRSLETGQEREITPSPKFSDAGYPRELRWAPDGRSILIWGWIETGRKGIYRVDIDTGILNPVVLDAPKQTRTDWQLRFNYGRVAGDTVTWGESSLDGKTLFFGRVHMDWSAHRCTRCRLLARDLETGQETEIYRAPDELGTFRFAVSPDGQRLVIADRTSLVILPTAGGEPRELLKLDWGFDYRTMALTPDSRYLLYVKVDQGTSELWRVAAEGGEPQRLDTLLARPGFHQIHPLRVHPDGRQIAFTAGRPVREGRIRMMQIVVSDEMAKEMCTANLRRIGKAIEQYKNDHDDVPDAVFDLYPDYLQDTSVLLCPADRTDGTPLAGDQGPSMPCSYRYMFGPGTEGISALAVELPASWPAQEGMTWKDLSKLQLKYYGPVVPTMKCQRHRPPLFLGYDGEVYETKDYNWEWSLQGKAGLLSRLTSAMQSEPVTWAQWYDIERLHCSLTHIARWQYYRLKNALLDPAVAHREVQDTLTKLLKTHLKEHPEDETAREFLAELPKLRSIYQSHDDAEEDGDGHISLRSSALQLIHHPQQGDQVVGIRFQDIPVPQGARVKRAYVQFAAFLEEPGSEKTDLALHAELAANAETFAEVKQNITSRQRTVASVKWSPEPWTVPGERSQKQRTPDLSSLIQEVVDQPDWQKGNALVLIISGSGRRIAQSWDWSWNGQPMLYVEH